MTILVRSANEHDVLHAARISREYAASAQQRGIGIAFRAESYIAKKMTSGDAVVAFVDDEIAGFCYIETFENKKYVSNSGLIVIPAYRQIGLAKRIKQQIFDLSRNKYPNSKIFSITTSGYVLKMNSDLGYKPVMFADLTSDDEFWANCQTCRNFDILTRNDRKLCLCTGMLYDQTNNKTNLDEE
ncbi:MAG: GNAT family N-acetyltransferase [Saprospiraceae bacterium]|nr:GNAT family N-acetyltransferase [Saprospiraceae bacterium]